MNRISASKTNPLDRLGNLGSLWPFLRRQRGLFTAWLIALAISSTATLSLPAAVKRMIDQGFSGDGDQINHAFVLLLLAATVLALATAARFYFVSLLGEKVTADLRSRLYAHLIAMDIAFYERNRSGELMSRLSADSELLRGLIGSTMSVAVRSSLTVIGSLVMLFVTNPRLAGFAVLGIPLAVLPIVLGARRLRKIARTSQDRVAHANGLAAETLGAVRIVQAHTREDYEHGRFARALDEAIASAQQRIGAQAIMTAVAIVLVFGAIVMVLWLGAHDVITGRTTPGTLSQFMLYAVIGGGSIGVLAEVWNELQRASGGMERINELLQEQPVILAPATPRPLPTPLRGEICFEQVSFHYPQHAGRPALSHFDLHVRPGETLALVGPSGGGKSTVLSLLMRFHDPQSGQISIDGIDLRQCDPRALREHIALVPQHPTLFAATAAQNIRYGRLQASDADIQAAAISAEADGFLQTLPNGYDSELGEHGARLSGGQQQRIAIARALLKDAPILLLDEATSALDAQSEGAVQQALERLMAGRTTLIIAHRLATVLKADRIVVIDGGRIVAQGTHAELLAEKGLYAELAKLQFIDQ